jgi:serine/threonine protein kinase
VDSLAEIGSTANSYQVLAKLATGGMAEIFLARSAGLGAVQRYVVLKRVLRERAGDVNFMRMFLDEARLAAQLQHPNIAQVYDVGKLGDSYFFTMEYVHGETIRAVIQRAHQLRRSPPIECVLAIAAGAAAGLHHAHERIGINGVPLGIVHRDVSPSNLMIGYDGSVKLVDFGVAKASDRVQETRSGAVKGKISYLSPEQAQGKKLDRRSDLFSLGIVLWELLTVERLFKHDSDFATMAAIVRKRTPPPSSRRRDIPPELDKLVLRALTKSPDDRYQTAEELTEAIEHVAVQTGSTLSTAGVTRFLRELFGTRPEPWMGLQAAEARPEIITVTSEPIPKEIQIPISDPIDQRLAAVVDLSGSEDPASPGIEPVTASLSIPRAPTWTPPASQSDSPQAASPQLAATPSPLPADVPSWTESSPPSRRLPIMLGGIALTLALVIGIIVAFPSAELTPATTSRAQRDAPATSVPSVTASTLTASTDPALPVDASPAPIELAVEPANVGVAQIAPNASPEPARTASEITPPTTPPPPPELTLDAGIEPSSTPIAGTAEVKPPPPRRTRPRVTKPRPDLIEQFEAAHYADVVAECVANTTADRVRCTLAACHMGDAAKARKWLARVPAANRARVVEACRATGITLVDEDDKPKKDCQADPMACPR